MQPNASIFLLCLSWFPSTFTKTNGKDYKLIYKDSQPNASLFQRHMQTRACRRVGKTVQTAKMHWVGHIFSQINSLLSKGRTVMADFGGCDPLHTWLGFHFGFFSTCRRKSFFQYLLWNTIHWHYKVLSATAFSTSQQ